MSQESKPADPVKEEAAEEPRQAVAAGKQAEVESDEEDGVDETTGDVAASGEPSASKKKKSKRKKVKAALSGMTGKSADPQADLKKAIANLPPAQLAELMKLNPALAEELSKAQAEGAASGNPDASALEALKRLNLQDIMTGLATSGKNVKDMASYKFWQTQPVPRFGEEPSGQIQEGPFKVQKVEDVPQEPSKLVEGFEWDFLDLTDKKQLEEVYELLSGHFVEDDEAMFRFRYSTSILKWAMLSPGWKKEWHRGVRATQSKKLVAFIAAIPLDLQVRKNTLKASEVNFMVIHKKLRSKRLAPVLIKEITRLCNLEQVWQAIYTGGVVLPRPVSTCRYFHRAINWQKLWEVGFSPLPPNSKPQYQVRKYALPDQTATGGLREMEAKDIGAVQDLLMRYLKRFDLYQEFNEEEVEHWFLHKKDSGEEQAIWTYVVEDSNKNITDFFSFYALDSSIINNPKHDVIHAAYLFYYATEVGLTSPLDKAALKTRLNALVSDALILAKRFKFDVFNALSLMDNPLFLEQQKFGPGDGQLHYYLFNYNANPIAGGVNKRNQLDEDNLSGIGYVMM